MNTRSSKSNKSDGSSGPRKIVLQPRRVDYPRRDREHREEYAAEVAPIPAQVNSSAKETEDADTGSGTMGYVSLALGIASLFIWSIVTGPLAAILGYYAYTNGQKTTGAWAMGLGIVATLSFFVMMPFAR